MLVLYFLPIIIGIIDDSSCSDQMKLVLAEDILANISQGNSVEYNDVNIVGDLALGKLNLTKDDNGRYLIKSPILIRHSNFNGKVLFGNAKFLNFTEFIDNNFNDEVKFNNAEFNKGVIFGYSIWGSSFNKQASFSNSIFNGEANFESVQFRRIKDTDPFYEDLFLNATFNDKANFDNASFNGNAYFTGARFNKDASFQYVRFQKGAIFGDFSGMPGWINHPMRISKNLFNRNFYILS